MPLHIYRATIVYPNYPAIVTVEAPNDSEGLTRLCRLAAGHRLLNRTITRDGQNFQQEYLRCRIARQAPHARKRHRALRCNPILPGRTIGQAGGRLHNADGRFVYPIMHPAAGLRRGEFAERIRSHFTAIPGAIRQLREDPPPPELAARKETPQTLLF